MHPRVLKELNDRVAEPLCIIFGKLWLLGKVLRDWKKGNITPIDEEGRKEDPGNYRPVSLIAVPGKFMKQILLDYILRHMRDERVI